MLSQGGRTEEAEVFPSLLHVWTERAEGGGGVKERLQGTDLRYVGRQELGSIS